MPAAEIAGSIQTRAEVVRAGCGNEAARGKIRPPQITACESPPADDNLAEDGTFTAPPNDPVPVRVIRTRHDEPFGNVRSPGWVLYLNRGQIPLKPVDRNTVTVAGTTYVIRSVAEDPRRTRWTCDVDEVVP